jgi:hypothetical protein
MNINKQHLLFTSLLCIFIVLLNQCKLMYHCAAVFASIITLCNIHNYFFISRMKDLLIIITPAIIISIILAYISPYYLYRQLIPNLVAISLASLWISIFFSVNILSFLVNKFNFIVSSLIALVISSTIDVIIVSIVVCNTIPYFNLIDILSKEIIYKLVYGIIIHAIMLIKNINKPNINLCLHRKDF